MGRKKEKNPDAPRGQRAKTVAAIFAAIIGLIGLTMLMYPTIAEYVNAYNNKRIIERYKEQVRQIVEELGDDRYAEIVDDVLAYNAALYERSIYIGTLTDEQRAVYEDTLNIMGTGVIGYIEVEKADIALTIYHGTDEGVLHAGVGHIEGSSFPFIGENVHSILSAHSGLPSAKLFTNIDRLVVGDTFTVHVLNEVLTYAVEDIQVILPDEVDKLLIEKGANLCTLMTCTPYGVNSHRLLVTGRLVEKSEDLPSGGSSGVQPTNAPGGSQSTGQKNPFTIPLPVIIPVVLVAGAVLAILLVRNLRRRG